MIHLVFATVLSLSHNSWILQSMDGQAVTAHRPTLTFDAADSRASGMAGCNRFTGGYTQRGWRLRFEAVAMTRMMCLDEAMHVEDAFTKVLSDTRSWKILDGELSLYDATGKRLARFIPEE
jgi:heat shock protein HslJ